MSDKSDTGLDDPSDTILNIGNNVMYIKKDPHKPGVIQKVHYDDSPPFYTVGFPDGSEVQTIRIYLKKIPTPVKSPMKKIPKPVKSPMKKQAYSIGDEVIWTGEGLPNNSIIIGVPSNREETWVDIRTNTGRRLTVPGDEINRNIETNIMNSLDKFRWKQAYIRTLLNKYDTIVNILALLTIPPPPTPMPTAPDRDFEMMLSYQLHDNWRLYRKFKYEWKNQEVYRAQIREYRRNVQYIEYEDDADNTDMIVLLQATSNIIGRPIHFITEHIPWMNVVTVIPDSTISAAELHTRRITHGENSLPDAHPVWIKRSTPSGYQYSTDRIDNIKTKNYSQRHGGYYTGYTHRDGGYYIGDAHIPPRFITTKEEKEANEVIKKTEQERLHVIRLGQRSAQERDNRDKGCCGGSARSHRKRKNRKTRNMLKNRKKIETTHKRGRKTNTRKQRKTPKRRK